MSKFSSFSPLEDRCLIRPIKSVTEEKTDSGIVIPETVKKDVLEGEVVAIGQGKYAPENGVFIPTVLAKGDFVLFGASQGLPIMIDSETGKEEVLIMREGDILMLISKKE